MGRWLVCAVVLAVAGTAYAGPTRKVTITSDPAGATVWLNDKESDPVCPATPCTIDAPIGETPMIIELAGFDPNITVLEVARGAKTLVLPPFKLEGTSGFIKINYDGEAEAKIKIDGKSQGKAPQTVTVDAGTHKVVVTAGGHTILDQSVDVDVGKTVELTGTAPELPPGPPPPDPPDQPPGGGDIVKHPPAKPRDHFITVSALFDVGFRQFSYSNAVAPMSGANNVGDDSEKGQLMAGPLVEFDFGELLGVPAVRGLGLVARLEFGLNQQSVNDGDLTMPTTTFWQSIEVSVRDRFTLADGAFAVEPSAGYTRDRYQFNGADNDIALVPDVDYQAVKLGVRGYGVFGSVEPYVDLQNRVVVSGGDLQNRFAQASANGVHAALGLMVKSGNLTGRFEAAFTRYGWSFSNNGALNPIYNTDGATDAIEQISLSFGYSY